MAMIRGKVHFGDGGRGLAAIGLGRNIVIGKPTFFRKDGKLYDLKTKEELKPIPLWEFLEKRDK